MPVLSLGCALLREIHPEVQLVVLLPGLRRRQGSCPRQAAAGRRAGLPAARSGDGQEPAAGDLLGRDGGRQRAGQKTRRTDTADGSERRGEAFFASCYRSASYARGHEVDRSGSTQFHANDRHRRFDLHSSPAINRWAATSSIWPSPQAATASCAQAHKSKLPRPLAPCWCSAVSKPPASRDSGLDCHLGPASGLGLEWGLMGRSTFAASWRESPRAGRSGHCGFRPRRQFCARPIVRRGTML